MRTPRRLAAAAVAAILLAPVTPATAAAPSADAPTVSARLAPAFRVDLTYLHVTLDYRPRQGSVSGVAVLRFRMRPGQTRPLFHFNPLRAMPPAGERRALRSVRLDGAPLDPDDDADVRVVRPAPGAETAFEVRRRVTDRRLHTLRIGWTIRAPETQPGWLYPGFDDTEGPDDETETLWPTVSSPDELARHVVRLRVHAARPYRVIGSGVVARRASRGGLQQWRVDTRRAVSSSTVFFAAAPARGTRVVRFRAAGVPVTILSDRDAATTSRARAVVRHHLPVFRRRLGPVPPPEVSVLLTGWDSGMEYYGATRTGLGSLRHELLHLWFGTATVNRTWRDTWFDEAAVTWLEEDGDLPPLPRSFRFDLARNRPIAAPGFNEAAYGNGARVLENVARALGGDRRMVAFLADLHHRRAFHPFTTDQLIDDVVAAQDGVTRRDLRHWLYSPRRAP